MVDLTGKWFMKGKALLYSAGLNYTSATVRVMLLHSGASAAINTDTNQYVSTLQTYECLATGGGYPDTTAATLGTKSVYEDTANDRIELLAANIVFTITGAFDAGKIPRYILIYKWVTSWADSPVLGLLTMSEDVNVLNDTWTIDWDEVAGVLADAL